MPNAGTVDQVADYLLSTAEAGAEEVLIDLQQTTTTTDELRTAAETLIRRSRAQRSRTSAGPPAVEARPVGFRAGQP